MKKYLFLFLIFLAPALFAQSAKTFYDRAAKETSLQEKINLYTKAIEKAPRWSLVYYQRADIYKKQKRYKKAIEDYTKAIKFDPKDPFKYYSRALTYIEQGSYSPAMEDLTKAISLKNNYEDFYLKRALCYMETNKYKLALNDFKKVKKTDTKLLQAKAHYELHEYRPATNLLEEILKQNPQDIQALFYLGKINSNIEFYDEAIAYFSKILNIEPNNKPALRARANAFKEVDLNEEVIKDYNTLIELSPDSASYNRRGIAYERLKDWPAAIKDYDKAIELNPKWAVPYNNRAYCYMKLKNFKEAKKDLDTALKLAPKAPTTLINTAGYYWTAKKDKKNMYKHLQTALKNNFKDFDSLYDDNQKGWMFKNINESLEFRSFSAPYNK